MQNTRAQDIDIWPNGRHFSRFFETKKKKRISYWTVLVDKDRGIRDKGYGIQGQGIRDNGKGMKESNNSKYILIFLPSRHGDVSMWSFAKCVKILCAFALVSAQ